MKERTGARQCGDSEWRPYDPTAIPLDLSSRRGSQDFSDIPIFDAQNIPVHVHNDPAWKDKPFILREDAGLAALSSRFERSAVLETADRLGLNTSVGHSWSIIRNGGEGPRRVPLREYVESIMHQSWHDGDASLERAYAFEPGADFPGLPNDVHPFINSWNNSAFDVPTSAQRIMLLGGAESGIGWHRHGAAVQMTIHGWKRWFLYPIGSYPPGDGPGGGLSIKDWFEIVYPTLDGDVAPLEFIQRPGDVVHIPDGWYHAVINLADTFAVSIQSLDFVHQRHDAFKEVSPGYIEHLRVEDPPALGRLVQAARAHMDANPGDDLDARRTLFYALTVPEPDQALEVMLQGARRDPFHVPTQYELARWLEWHASGGSEVALEAFMEIVSEWRPFLERSPRNMKALWVLSKYHKLAGDDKQHAFYRNRMLELDRRGIDR